MQKTSLAVAILAVLSTSVFAVDTSTSQPAPTPIQQPHPMTPEANDTRTAAASTIMPIPEKNIDCNYTISAQTDNIDSQLISNWSVKAAEQAFTFDSSQIDSQLDQLKKCFTPQGWQGFQEAFNQSGNLNAIKSQQLNVSAMTDSVPVVTQEKDKSNEWKVSFPMSVVYQNKQQKLTQELNVEVLVGRKLTGDLGIMQIVAAPKNVPEAPSTTSTPSASSASTAVVTPTTSTSPGASTPTEPGTQENSTPNNK